MCHFPSLFWVRSSRLHRLLPHKKALCFPLLTGLKSVIRKENCCLRVKSLSFFLTSFCFELVWLMEFCSVWIQVNCWHPIPQLEECAITSEDQHTFSSVPHALTFKFSVTMKKRIHINAAGSSPFYSPFVVGRVLVDVSDITQLWTVLVLLTCSTFSWAQWKALAGWKCREKINWLEPWNHCLINRASHSHGCTEGVPQKRRRGNRIQE